MSLPPKALKFLESTAWANVPAVTVTADWSPRHYWRLTRGKETAILLHAPENIPGHGLADFMHLSDHLRAAGLSAPDIYAADLKQNFLLIEDFGDTSIDHPVIEKDGYEAAVDLLGTFRNDAMPLTRYKDGYIYKKLELFSNDPAWMAAWDEAESKLPPAPLVFAHMDYKAGNLHWLPARKGTNRIGLLDFQAAQRAPFTYDIVNLLEDARRDLNLPLKVRLKKRFYDALPEEWQPMFHDWYDFMAAQFHARILGQIRNTPRVAADIEPRLRAYLEVELQAQSLGPVRDWGQKTGLLK